MYTREGINPEHRDFGVQNNDIYSKLQNFRCIYFATPTLLVRCTFKYKASLIPEQPITVWLSTFFESNEEVASRKGDDRGFEFLGQAI